MPKLTDNTKKVNDILHLHEKGELIGNIALKTEIHVNTVRRLFKNLGLKSNRLPQKYKSLAELTDIDIEKILSMWDSGESIRKIAKTFNLERKRDLPSLLKKHNRSRVKKRTIPNIGDVFFRLTVLGVIKIENKTFLQLKCTCGKEIVRKPYRIFNDRLKSCGCLLVEVRKLNGAKGAKKRTKHTPEEASAHQMWSGNYRECPKEVYFKLAKMPCHYCGAPPKRNSNRFKTYIGTGKFNDERIIKANWINNGLDRVDSRLGHTEDNVVPCCWTCNRAKSNMSYDMFIEWLDELVKFRRNKNA